MKRFRRIAITERRRERERERERGARENRNAHVGGREKVEDVEKVKGGGREEDFREKKIFKRSELRSSASTFIEVTRNRPDNRPAAACGFRGSRGRKVRKCEQT